MHRERVCTFLEKWGILLGGEAVGALAAEEQWRVAPKPPDFTLLHRYSLHILLETLTAIKAPSLFFPFCYPIEPSQKLSENKCQASQEERDRDRDRFSDGSGEREKEVMICYRILGKSRDSPDPKERGGGVGEHSRQPLFLAPIRIRVG